MTEVVDVAKKAEADAIARATFQAMAVKVSDFMDNLLKEGVDAAKKEGADPGDVAILLADHLAVTGMMTGMSRGDLMEMVCDAYQYLEAEMDEEGCPGCEGCEPDGPTVAELKN